MGRIVDDGVRLRALIKAPYLRHALFGDDRTVLERRHRLIQSRHDRGDLRLVMPGRERDVTRPTPGMQRTYDEIHGAAEAGVDPTPNAAGVRLVEEVDLKCGINTGHQRPASDTAGVVCHLRAQHPHSPIEVYEVIEILAAEEEGRREWNLVIQGSATMQLKHAVGKHLGLDPQLSTLHQIGQDRVGYIAYAELQGGAVRHMASDQLANLLGDVSGMLGLMGGHGLFDFD